MKYKRIIWLVSMFLIWPCAIFAQPGHPGNGPIGGLVYLLLVGIGFGVYSLRKKKN